MATTQTAGTDRGCLHLNQDEKQTAIYLDFEGTAVDSPSLLGVLIEGGSPIVFEPVLEPAAKAKAVELGGTCRFTTPAEALVGTQRHASEPAERRARLRLVDS